MKILDKLENAFIEDKESITITIMEFNDILSSLFDDKYYKDPSTINHVFKMETDRQLLTQGHWGIYKNTLHIYVSKPL